MNPISPPALRRLLARFAFVLAALWTFPAHAQTPSPMAEWQYASGIPLIPYFTDKPPEWQVELGLGAGPTPRYEGSKKHTQQPGPLVNIRYKDLAFFSLGEGLGINFVSGKGYRAGAALVSFGSRGGGMVR